MRTNVPTLARVDFGGREHPSGSTGLQVPLLLSGLIASLYYVALNIAIPMFAEGYSVASQTVSELSAIGAPTRVLWIALMIPYSGLVIAFGWGIARYAERIRLLPTVGVLFVVHGVVGLIWPPMHLRGDDPTFTDTLHIAFTIVTVAIFVLQIVLAAATLDRPFLIYSFFSLAVMLTFGILTSLEAPGIHTGLATPMIGVWERISIGAYELWMAVLAIILVRKTREWT